MWGGGGGGGGSGGAAETTSGAKRLEVETSWERNV